MSILDLQDMQVPKTAERSGGSNKSNNRCGGGGGKGGGGDAGSWLSLLLC